MSHRDVSALLLAMLALAACYRPITNTEQLRAIRTEAMALAKTYPPRLPLRYRAIAKKDWPEAIAGLRPEAVTAYAWGIDIAVKPSFDGGWGYQVPREIADLPMPTACYSEAGDGVFWHGPC